MANTERKYRELAPTAQLKVPEVVQLQHQGIKPEEIAVQLGDFGVLKDPRAAHEM